MQCNKLTVKILRFQEPTTEINEGKVIGIKGTAISVWHIHAHQ